jgi:hypothetical protein
MKMNNCGKCGKMHRGKDRYCSPCRKAYNVVHYAKDKAARSDKYYWRVTVPRLRARLERKTPILRGKPGAYRALQLATFDGDGFTGMVFHRTGERPEDE